MRIRVYLNKRNETDGKRKVLIVASVASMIGQFNMSNIHLLQEMDCEVYVACNFKKGNTCDCRSIIKLQHTLDKLQVHQYQWDCPRNISAVNSCIKAYMQLCKIIRNERFTILHCHSPIGGALARLVAHFYEIPVIYTAHGFHFYQGAPLKNWILYYPAEKLLARWTNVLITINKEDYIFAGRYLSAQKVYRIPGVGVDIRYFTDKSIRIGDITSVENPNQKQNIRSAFRKKHCISQNAVLLLSVGELNQGKNHRVVLEALARLQEENICYMICGQGGQREQLLRLAEKLKVRNQVRIPGYIANIKEAYQAADIFIFPSIREGMPMSLMEAMASGLPVIASRIRGNTELIRGQGGLLVKPKDTAGFALAIQWLYIWKKQAPQYLKIMGTYNRNQIQKYDICNVESRMQKIYEKIFEEAENR